MALTTQPVVPRMPTRHHQSPSASDVRHWMSIRSPLCARNLMGFWSGPL